MGWGVGIERTECVVGLIRVNWSSTTRFDSQCEVHSSLIRCSSSERGSRQRGGKQAKQSRRFLCMPTGMTKTFQRDAHESVGKREERLHSNSYVKYICVWCVLMWILFFFLPFSFFIFFLFSFFLFLKIKSWKNWNYKIDFMALCHYSCLSIPLDPPILQLGCYGLIQFAQSISVILGGDPKLRKAEAQITLVTVSYQIQRIHSG